MGGHSFRTGSFRPSRVSVQRHGSLLQAFSRVLQGQQKLVPAVTSSSFSTSNAVNAADLRTTVAEKNPAAQEEVKAFRKSHGGAKIGEITVDSLYGGMRMKGLDLTDDEAKAYIWGLLK